MFLKRLFLKNFRSYAGENEIVFGPALTLIVGDNGDGKSTAVDALKWLLDTTEEGLVVDPELFSAKAFKNLQEGMKQELKVQLEFEHEEVYTLTKGFWITKSNGKALFSVNNHVNFYAQIKRKNGTNEHTDARKLINDIFDLNLQKFCIFQGEQSLSVLTQSKGLGTLLEKLTDIQVFDNVLSKSKNVSALSEKAYEAELDSDKKTTRKLKKLQKDREQLLKDIEEIQDQINIHQTEIKIASDKIEELERNKNVYDTYTRLGDEVSGLKDKERDLREKLDIKLDLFLLDKLWILRGSLPIIDELEEVEKKVTKEKRRLREEWIKEQALKQGVVQALCNSRLPLNNPGRLELEKMLTGGRCEVCGQPILKDSEAYKFIKRRIDEIIESIKGKKTEDLFQNQYIDEVSKMVNSKIDSAKEIIHEASISIEDTIEQYNTNKNELDKVLIKINDKIDEMNSLVSAYNMEGNSILQLRRILETSLESRGSNKTRIDLLNKQEEDKQKQLEDVNDDLANLGVGSKKAVRFLKLKYVLQKVCNALAEARETDADNFIQRLQDKANSYLEKLSGKDFYGTLRFIRNKNDVEIKVIDLNGIEILTPSGSQRTSQYMSTLFAISELTSLKRDKAYPLIFDAPTSSFGAGKETIFYNTVSKLDKQCVILTKDLIKADGTLDKEKTEQLSCKLYRIQKAEGFKGDDLTTIQTQVINLR